MPMLIDGYNIEKKGRTQYYYKWKLYYLLRTKSLLTPVKIRQLMNNSEVCYYAEKYNFGK